MTDEAIGNQTVAERLADALEQYAADLRANRTPTLRIYEWETYGLWRQHKELLQPLTDMEPEIYVNIYEFGDWHPDDMGSVLSYPEVIQAGTPIDSRYSAICEILHHANEDKKRREADAPGIKTYKFTLTDKGKIDLLPEAKAREEALAEAANTPPQESDITDEEISF